MLDTRFSRRLLRTVLLAAAIVVLGACDDDDDGGGGGKDTASDASTDLEQPSDTSAPSDATDATADTADTSAPPDGSDADVGDEDVPPTEDAPPNILFIVLDDFGVDQLTQYGYGGATAPATPHLDAIAAAGVRFRNAWSMPTCTPTRSTFFVGRYPSRTNVLNAVVALDLANSQVSPYELTTPKVLREKGYKSGLVGKMHLTGSDLGPANHPFGEQAMWKLGWDEFEGYLDGGPYPIDTTAGGVGEEGTYHCGFVPNTTDDPEDGADAGACYFADGSCVELTTVDAPTPGRACLERGGILDPGQSCAETTPAHLDFTRQNGYYTGKWVVSGPDGSAETREVTDPRTRGYRTTLETDRAIDWIQRQSSDTPWMLSLGYSANHTPLQPPPAELARTGLAISTTGCGADDGAQLAELGLLPERMAEALVQFHNIAEQRLISNQMIEAMDNEIGRLLVETGIATRAADGSLQYDPSASNTMIVIMGDNGTYAPTVKAPFNPTRGKGFPYQGGVWVPLVVAGPLVAEPGRDVEAMLNSADLYALFAEIAGIDLSEVLPANRTVDAHPVLPYLTNPAQDAVRATNFTEMGTNITATGVPLAPPCVIPAYNVCVQIFPQEGVCHDQSGIWYGPGGDVEIDSCCAVNEYLVGQGEAPVDVLPHAQKAVRNERYKLVRIERIDCETGERVATDELYAIDQDAPIPALDNPDRELLAAGSLDAEAQAAYEALVAELEAIEQGNVQCPGDGNLDRVVDQTDLDNWAEFAALNGGRSSWYDFNHDGLTNEEDRAIIEANLGDCP